MDKVNSSADIHSDKKGLLIVEDEAEFAEWVFRTLSAHASDLEVFIARDLQKARTLLRSRPQGFWEMAIVDLNLGREDGVDLIAEASGLSPQTILLVVTSVDSPEKALDAIRAGAHGYVLKTAVDMGLISAFDQAREGGSPITPSIARQLLIKFREKPEDVQHIDRLSSEVQEKLSAREKDVLKLIARGYSNKESGLILGISPATVDSHIRGIYRKLSINSRVELRRLLK